MERAVKDMNILKRFCTDFCAVIDKHARYIIVSGFVAIAAGRMRGTEDIDMILERIDKPRFLRLHEDLLAHGFVCLQSDNPQSIFDDYLQVGLSARYTFNNHPVPDMEIKFAKDELDAFQLAHRTKIPLTGLDVWFGTIEMNIAFKEEYLKSEKDMEDAKHLRKVFPINERAINEYKKMIRKVR